MRDLKERDEVLFGTRNASDEEALERTKVALKFIYEDETRSMHDKVAGDFDYEELVAALVAARDALQRGIDEDRAREKREEAAALSDEE